jgi:hypothetical protein
VSQNFCLASLESQSSYLFLPCSWT